MPSDFERVEMKQLRKWATLVAIALLAVGFAAWGGWEMPLSALGAPSLRDSTEMVPVWRVLAVVFGYAGCCILAALGLFLGGIGLVERLIDRRRGS